MADIQKEDVAVLYRVAKEGQYFLLFSHPTREDVQLIRFETLSGSLQYTGTPAHDLFKSQEDALAYLNQQGDVQVEGKGEAVLGYIVIGNTGLLLLVERARVSAVLPGNVNIKTVLTARWHRIPCKARPNVEMVSNGQNDASINYEGLENHISKICDFPIHGAHWYCEDADVTRPFPSHRSPHDPSWQFTWNAWLIESFRAVQLDFCCPPLMEGTAESREHVDGMGDIFNLVLLSRRSRLNPGTRYIARGLNDLCEPGNEIECEQIVWKPETKPDGKACWNRYAWRRGTVPIRWGVLLKNSGLGEAEIVIRKQRTFSGCKRYIRRLQKRFMPLSEIEDKLKEVEEDKRASDKFPIVFISLLRKGLPDKNMPERNLAGAFDKALSQIRKMHHLNVMYYGLDWHEMDKQLGTQGLIEALWVTKRGMLKSHSFASGYYSDQPSSDEEVPKTDWCGAKTMQWFTQQQGLARYNCADSLDRTNIASFFVCVQVFVEQCRRLELAVLTGDDEEESTPAAPKPGKPSFRERLFGGLIPGTAANQPPVVANQGNWPSVTGRGHRHRKVQFRQQLPAGWEAKVDPESGRTYYVDHVNKATSWELPPDFTETTTDTDSDYHDSKKSFRTRCKEEILSKEAWAMLDATVDEVRRKVLPEALTSMADVFLQNGDRNAFFYTGSQAMHSDKIMIFERESSQLKKNTVGGASNSLIAITRRYNNVIKDTDRQVQIELFLGINLEKHLLSSSTAGQDLVSLNIVYQPRELPQDISDTDDEDDPVEELSYHATERSVIAVPSEPELETRRSVSSPNLASYEYGGAPFGEAVDDGENEIQMYALEDIGTLNQKPERSNSPEAASPSAPLVPGLRSMSTPSEGPLA